VIRHQTLFWPLSSKFARRISTAGDRGQFKVEVTQTRHLIVLAGSDPESLVHVSHELSRRGYEVALAGNGYQALEAIRDRLPAAAVLDWIMPGMQGPAACAELKRDAATAAIPVVLLTARAGEEDIATAFEQGAAEYLTKPFAIDELDDVLRRVITRG
jgi:DNA-binding response OmpR family regulator